MSWWRRAAAVALAALLAGCGFQLRGSFSIPEPLQPVHIASPPGSDVARELESMLRNSGVKLAGSRAGARSEIEILEEERERRVLSVSASTADVDQYELRYTTRWLLRETGEEVRPLTNVETVRGLRDYNFDRNAVLAKQSEEAALIEDLQEDAALRILYRLQAWDPADIPDPADVEVEEALGDE